MSTVSDLGRVALFILRNVVAFVLFWLIAFALVTLAYRRFTPGPYDWMPTQIGLTLGCAIGTALAFRLRASLTGWLLVAMTGYAAARFVIEPIFGSRAVAGRTNHLISIAVWCGIAACAWVLTHYVRRNRIQRLAS